MGTNFATVLLIALTVLLLTEKGATTTCHCTSHLSECSSENSTCTAPSGFCRADVQKVDGALEVFKSCVTDSFAIAVCQQVDLDRAPNWCSLCCNTDYCNSDDLVQRIKDECFSTEPSPTPVAPDQTATDFTATVPVTDSTPSPPNGSGGTEAPAYAVAVITVLAVTVIVIIAVISIVLCIHYYPRCIMGTGNGTIGTPTITIDSGSCGEPSLNELLEDSGSGSGLPLLIQRSIAGQIALHELIGKGRFGEVWKGSYKGDEIAVKLFHTREEPSWVHEVNIYQTCLIRHPNILRFIAADNKDVGIQTQLWLITEFCEYGSLYDLLVNQSVDETTMLKLAYTAACGLDHLHAEIIGTEGKPAIVHRDLKSRNILVKGDFSCCIADLGLALRYDRVTDTLEDPPSKRVGTRRYLAPEIIDESISVKNFEAFKRSDIYSFGLVLWEIGRRGECGGYAEDAELPYFDSVPVDPSFEDMKKVVVVERRRPGIPNHWSQSEVFRSFSRIIQQCWLHDSEARLSTLRVKKNLANLTATKSEKKTENL